MSKFTRGPWFVERLSTLRVMELVENTTVVSSGSYPNTLIHAICLGGEKTSLQNAKLIAAAPELLEALKRIQYQLEIGNAVSTDDAFHKLAKAVIAKAEGDEE